MCYNRFYHQSPQATYPVENGAVTATLFRIIDVVALVPEAHYYFGPDNGVVPYLGMGAGFASVKFHVLVSDFDLSESSAGLILSPEGGMLIPFDRDGHTILQAFTVGLRWSFITAGFRDVSNTSYIGLTSGLLAYEPSGCLRPRPFGGERSAARSFERDSDRSRGRRSSGLPALARQEAGSGRSALVVPRRALSTDALLRATRFLAEST